MALQQKIKRKLYGLLGIREKHGSETAKVRHLVLNYCNGYGCDVGFGGDKIKKDAVGIDFAKPYAFAGDDKVDIACDLSKDAIPVPDNTYDYVYSSHLIEDFEDTERILKDFIRILKNNGNLILVFPDQPEYERICQLTNQPLNIYHVHKDMGFDYMMNCLKNLEQQGLGSAELLFKSNIEIDYNVVIVVKMHK